MNPSTRILLCIAIIFSCITPVSAQQPKPPEQINTTPRQDKQADAAHRDLPSYAKQERSGRVPSSSDPFANLSARQKRACNKLSIAADKGRTDEVRRLLARGVHAYTCGTLALLMISPRGQVGPAQVESAKVLLAAGADPRALMFLGPHGAFATPLKLAWDYSGPDREKVFGELVEAMLVAERKLGWKEEYCSSGGDGGPLLFIAAAFARDVSQVEMLLAKGADVNQKSCRGWTALMTAVWMGNSENVKALIAAGADLNAQMDDGATALSFAMKKGHSEIVRLLKQAGAKH